MRNKNTNYFNDYKIINKQESEFYIVNKKGMHFTVKVDTEDLYRLIKFNRSWNAKLANGEYYASCCEYLCQENGKPKYKIHYLHRWIFNDPPNVEIDHIYHKTLDNRKSQLRSTERPHNDTNRKGKNSNNKSGYRNVFWDKQKQQWSVGLCKNCKRIQIGYYDDLEEAGKVAEQARQKYYGTYAGLN